VKKPGAAPPPPPPKPSKGPPKLPPPPKKDPNLVNIAELNAQQNANMNPDDLRRSELEKDALFKKILMAKKM
jgi:hypothetical protein